MKKTIQRVLAAVILFAMILSGGFSEVGKVHAEKQQGTTKRAIYVVFDNSGSMYGDGNKAWSQATYAMEVFAAMMNYESGDVMKVFPMHDITTDGNTEFPIVKDTTPNMMNPRLYTTSYNKP